jgi:transmembrane sensor
MSDQDHEEHSTMTRSEVIGVRAADWMLTKRLSESWSKEDEDGLDSWLAESPANLLAYWRLEAAWGSAQRLKALRSPTRGPNTSSKARSGYIAKLAAVAAIIVVSGAAWFGQSYISFAKTYATPVGGHLTLSLTDGSKIDLNTDTILSISESQNSRLATLEKGEAYFQIRHDEAHPFILSVSNHRVTDLGTKFLVRDAGSRVQVALIEGRARFESASASTSIQATDLAPGDVITATTNSISVAKKTATELSGDLSWRRGVLVFDGTTLADAVSEINRYNHEKVVILDPSVARLTIGGTFPENDVSALIDTAKQVFGLNVQRRGDQIVISR